MNSRYKSKIVPKVICSEFSFTTYQLPFQNESSVAEWEKIDFRPFSKARKPRFDLSIKNFSISLITNEKKPVQLCGWSPKIWWRWGRPLMCDQGGMMIGFKRKIPYYPWYYIYCHLGLFIRSSKSLFNLLQVLYFLN